MTRIILFLLTLLVWQVAAAQLEGFYYLWQNQLNPASLKCMGTPPNQHWVKVSGPYFDGQCTQPAPPAHPQAASASQP
jgi:hypothetical protein